MNSNKSSRRSPIKQAPLRQPGQSLKEGIQEIQFEHAMIYVLIFGISISLLVHIWIDFLLQIPLGNPFFITILAFVAIAISLWKLSRYKKLLDAFRLGIEGEREVADNLEIMKADGAVIFHDLVGHSFNVDHVVLSRKGVFVIETKTRRKTPTSKVEYDGVRILIDGRMPKEDFFKQASAEATWISNEIDSGTGRRYHVKSIIVFPGWFVEGSGSSLQSEIWVLNPKAMVKIIQHQPDIISDEDVKLVAYFLSRLNR
jgi:hypothetical protein